MSPEAIADALSYRQPLEVTHMLLLANDDCYPICPKCGISLDREYMSYCDRCGQCLGWRKYNDAEIVYK